MEITSQAEAWRGESQQQWGKWTHPLRHLVGHASLVSPEDGGYRMVALNLSAQIRFAAFTCLPDSTDNYGRLIAPAGFYSIHINREHSFRRRAIIISANKV